MWVKRWQEVGEIDFSCCVLDDLESVDRGMKGTLLKEGKRER